jgi:hypothetical protein
VIVFAPLRRAIFDFYFALLNSPIAQSFNSQSLNHSIPNRSIAQFTNQFILGGACFIGVNMAADLSRIAGPGNASHDKNQNPEQSDDECRENAFHTHAPLWGLSRISYQESISCRQTTASAVVLGKKPEMRHNHAGRRMAD